MYSFEKWWLEYSQATLGYKSEETNIINWGCGGTLISEKWVMSAGHCMYNIRLGGGRLSSALEDEYLFTVVQKVNHPNYQATSVYNDICLLMLDKEWVFYICTSNLIILF